MKPQTPVVKGLNTMNIGANHPAKTGIGVLPSIVMNGKSLSRWSPTQAEREAIASGQDIFVCQLAYRALPISLTVGTVNDKDLARAILAPLKGWV